MTSFRTIWTESAPFTLDDLAAEVLEAELFMRVKRLDLKHEYQLAYRVVRYDKGDATVLWLHRTSKPEVLEFALRSSLPGSEETADELRTRVREVVRFLEGLAFRHQMDGGGEIQLAARRRSQEGSEVQDPSRDVTYRDGALTGWVGRTLVNRDGEKIGIIDSVYLDDASGQLEWLAVCTGYFGSNLSFVPVSEATTSGDDVIVPYKKSLVRDAPNTAPDGYLSSDEERRLYEHYGRSFGDWSYDDQPTFTDRKVGTIAYDTPRPTSYDAMTRSEEEVVVGTRRTQARRAQRGSQGQAANYGVTDRESGLAGWVGRTLMDRDGQKIGTIDDVYLDDASGRPEWLAVKTGFFGSNLSFVPVSEATASGNDVTVPYERSLVKDAPNAASDGHLSADEERRLYEHYGRDFGDWSYEDRSTYADREVGTTGYDTSGPTTADAKTRAEEELALNRQRAQGGRARLRKWEVITDANIGQAGGRRAAWEEEHEVVLDEEQPVVQSQVVPKERVRLDTDTVTEEQQVSEEVRKEVVEPEEWVVDLREADVNQRHQ